MYAVATGRWRKDSTIRGLVLAYKVRYTYAVVGKQEDEKMLGKVRWIPQGSQAVELPGVDAVAYVTGLVAVGYVGKRSKSEFNYRFKDEAARDAYVAKFLANQKAWAEQKAMEKAVKAAKRKSWVPDLKAGDILYGSWGYDQTNVEFVQVLEVKGKRALVQEVMHANESDVGYGGMAANVVPRPGEFMQGDSFKAVWKPLLMSYDGTTRIKWHDYCWLSKWDGRPKYKSWYA
jgi:hypothetical protein